MGEPRCSSSAIPRNLEQADLGRSTPPLVTLVYTETKMSTHKHSEAGNELRSLIMIQYDQSMNATTQRSKDSHFWHLTPLPAHRQVHTSHTPTSGPHQKPATRLVTGARSARSSTQVLAEVLNSSCHVMPRHILVILAGHFRDRVDLPKKNPTWGLA